MLFCPPISLNVSFFLWPFRESLQPTINLKLAKTFTDILRNSKQLLCVYLTSLIWVIASGIYISPACHEVHHLLQYKLLLQCAQIYVPSYLWCDGVMLWCETQLRWVVVWRYTVLCPAFQWLLSKHTQRWKPFLLTHTVNEALFCRTAAETQRAGPSGWSLCLLCTQIWHKI